MILWEEKLYSILIHILHGIRLLRIKIGAVHCWPNVRLGTNASRRLLFRQIYQANGAEFKLIFKYFQTISWWTLWLYARWFWDITWAVPTVSGVWVYPEFWVITNPFCIDPMPEIMFETVYIFVWVPLLDLERRATHEPFGVTLRHNWLFRGT